MILQMIWQQSRADLLERLRRSSFFIIVLATIVLSYLFVPPSSANYTAMAFGSHRLQYNSAVIGIIFGMLVSLFLSLFAFYLIKNGITLDRQTGVGRIIATTPMSKPVYLLGKWLSNLGILTLLLLIMSVMAPVMQWLRGESLLISVPALLLPIWLIGLPMMSVVAGTAVFFETVPFLRGGLGNIIYFFLWIFAIVTFLDSILGHNQLLPDPFGIAAPMMQIREAVTAVNPSYSGDLSLIGADSLDISGSDGIIVWQKTAWSAGYVLSRLLWLLSGACIGLLGAFTFDRFRTPAAAPKPSWIERKLAAWQAERLVSSPKRSTAPVTLAPIGDRNGRFRFGALFVAELKLLLKGQPWWWLAGLVGFIIFGIVTPTTTDLLPVFLACIWPVLIWSSLGARENQFHTQTLIFAAPHPLRRQLIVQWAAGVLLGWLICGGFLLSLVLAGELNQAAGIAAGAAFVPTLALALGVWSGSKRLFEIVYLCWWYIALNLATDLTMPLHFLSPHNGVLYGGLTAVLLTFAFVGRARQLKTQ